MTYFEMNQLEPKLIYFLRSHYNIDTPLASEMANDLIEIITAIDGNLDSLEKFYLN